MGGRHRAPRRVPIPIFVAALLVVGGVASAGVFVWRGGASNVAATRSWSPSPSAAGAASPPSPLATPSTAGPRARGALVIHGAGDVSLDPSYISTYATKGFGYAWSGLGGLFRRDDLTVVNVECPVSDIGTKVPGKEFNFRCDPDALPAMKAAGVEVGNMANNHAYDYGPEALVDTRRNLRRAGIAPVGAGRDARQANAPAIFREKGWTIAVVGLDEVTDPDYEVATATKPGTADGHDFQAMLAAVRAARARADLVVVAIHWGVELDTEPRAYQVEQGHELIDAGADVIFGEHSHRLQPFEMYRGRPIFYSLGNFVWPRLSDAGATTAVGEVRVGPSGKVTAKLLPAFIRDDGHPVLGQV